MTAVAAALQGSSLFGSIPAPILENVGRLMSPVSFTDRELVFRQGQPGHRLVVLESGELEVTLNVPGGEPLRLPSVLPGQVVGELSLLGDGRRTASVRAIEPSAGWALERAAFDVLRNNVSHPAGTAVACAIGNLAAERLNRLYRRTADEISGECAVPAQHDGVAAVDAEPGEAKYLTSTLFFQGFSASEIAAVTDGLRRVEALRDSVLVPRGQLPAALWIVVRGAVETTMRGSDTTRRLRLAGPGRAVGHIGLVREQAFVARIESRAREHAILIEVPWPRIWELLAAQDEASRRFAAALWTDSVRALEHGERPVARMSAAGAGGAAPG